MKKATLIAAFILEGMGVLVIFFAYRLGLQSLANPGAGLYPFLLGILLCLLAMPTCISSLNEFRKAGVESKEGRGLEYHANLKKLWAPIASLCGYFLLLDILGFLLTSFIFLFLLFLMGNPRRWVFPSLFSAGVVALAYLIFNILLQVPFPAGVWR